MLSFVSTGYDLWATLQMAVYFFSEFSLTFVSLYRIDTVAIPFRGHDKNGVDFGALDNLIH
jgi:hypothetical protein